MAVKRGGLGKGLSDLIPTDDFGSSNNKSSGKNTVTKTVTKEVVKEVVKEVEKTLKITEIEPNHGQPRKNFDEDALNELAESIKQFGVLEPLIVTKKDKYYEIIAGERRWRAARIAGIKEVPVVIRDYTPKEIMEISLIENIQREDLNPIEEALAYESLINEYNLKQDEVAERVSKSRSTITNSLRLLKLCDKVRQMVIDGMLTTGHVRALVPIEDEELQYEVAMAIFDQNLSVRETEAFVKKVLKQLEETNKPEIDYYSQDELDRITEMLYSINR